MHENGEIDFSVYDYLLNKDCRTPILYLLPKIHRGIAPPPGRPIIPAVGSHTEKIAQLWDHFLKPCAQKVTSYIRDTTHFLTLLESQTHAKKHLARDC